MSGIAIITELVGILTAGLVSMGQGIGSGIMAMINALFFTTTEGTTTLSVFAILIAVFAAISLAFALTRWVLNFITSWGNRNR